MKTVKRVLAALLCALMVITCFAGCHGKDAVVATVTKDKKEYEIKSGLYLVMLITAESEARSKVVEAVQAEDEDADTSDIKYSKHKIKADDGKEYKFNDYVVMRAKEMCSEYLVTAYLFDKYKLKLSDENASSLEQYAMYQWSYSGNGYMLEPNGASYDSYLQYLRVNMYYKSDLFDYFYGEDGEKAPKKDNIKTELKNNFTIANVLEISVKGDDGKDLKEAELKKIAEKIEAYCKRINDGKATFAEIKAEYEAETKKDDDKEEDKKDEETEDQKDDDKPQPKDKDAVVIGSDKTSVSSALFADVNKAEIGKAVLLKGTDGYYRLVLKQDIMADEYYYTTYRDETVRIMHAEDFNKYIAEQAKKLEVEYDSYELNYLKPGKISYDEYNEWYQGMLSNYGY